ncbi:ABC transporter permease [Thalassotalea atypica]|uniref:ABC transporter permease n=1 Tax=Thalassotalea atypica TaxID=2054316 RepID=UPI0025732BEF|nr:permease [Thalassotalea atypica]
MLVESMNLAWQFFKQDFASPHQKLLRWTQGVLLLFILTLSQTSENIQSYLHSNLQNLLGADAVITQQQALTEEQYSALTNIVDSVVNSQQLQVTLSHDKQWQTAKIKAVDDKYPLQGQLLTADTIDGPNLPTQGGPKVGEIWLDSRLLASLSLKVGDYLQVAERRLLVSKILVHEPDRLMEGHTVQQRAMISKQDLDLLGISADLISYRYLVEADNSTVDQLITWQQSELPAATLHHKKGAHPLALFWKRTENFMGLASIILFFMAAIAIEQLSHVYVKKERYFSAICMSFGATKTTGLIVSLWKWVFSFMLLIPLALVLSVVFQALLVGWLQDSFDGLTWQWNVGVAIKNIAFAVAIFSVFHFPVWLSLSKNTVGQLLVERTQGGSHWVNKIACIAVLFIVAMAYSDNGLLTTMMVVAMLITLILMILMSWLGLTLGEKVTQHRAGLVSFTFFMMKQRLLSKSTQIIGVGLSAFLLLFTLMLLKDLGATMSSYQRQHDGNLIVSQATVPQFEFIEKRAEELGINIRQSKPYMYGKLVAVNQQSLKEFSDKPSESMATLSRSIRMHWNESLPLNNKLVEGVWWNTNNDNWRQVSVEQEVMTDLGLVLGDRLTFFIGQQSHEFEITASHVFKSGNGSMTFWVQMPMSALHHVQAPHYSMSSLELADEHWSILGEFWQKYPTLRMVSLKEMTASYDSVLKMITQVISGFTLMIIALAMIVIFASVNAQESKEKIKNSIIMSFGLSPKVCLHLNVIEWVVTSTITAFGAIIGTYIAGMLIYQSQFSLTYVPDAIWLLLTTSVIVTFVTCLGIFASRSTLRFSIRQLLSDNN